MRRLERVGPGWRLAIVTVLALVAIALFMTFEVRSLHSALRFCFLQFYFRLIVHLKE